MEQNELADMFIGIADGTKDEIMYNKGPVDKVARKSFLW